MHRLKELRESRRITQSQLGEHIGAKKSAISLWESGKRQPDQETLVHIASFFGVTVDYLLGRDPHEATPPPPQQEKDPIFAALSKLNPENRALVEQMARKLLESQQNNSET